MIMTRNASPSILLNKSEVIYRDTGVSKNQILYPIKYCVKYVCKTNWVMQMGGKMSNGDAFV